jgi:hypothetical protein
MKSIKYLYKLKKIYIKALQNSENTDWNKLSLSNLDFPDIFINCIKYDWNWYNITYVPNLSCKFIETNINKFKEGSYNKYIVFSANNINITPKFIYKHINKPWDWTVFIRFNKHNKYRKLFF